MPRRSRGWVASWRVIPRRWGRYSTSNELDWGGWPYWNANACCVDGVLSKLALQDIQAVQKIVAEENVKPPLYLPPLSIVAVGFSHTVPTTIGLWSSIYQGVCVGPPRSAFTPAGNVLIWIAGVGVCDSAHTWISEHERYEYLRPLQADIRLRHREDHKVLSYFVGRSFRRGMSGAANQTLQGRATSQYVKQRLGWSKAKAHGWFFADGRNGEEAERIWLAERWRSEYR